MKAPRHTLNTVILTFAELAWLAVFASLLLLQGEIGMRPPSELVPSLKRQIEELQATVHKLTAEVAELTGELVKVRSEITKLTMLNSSILAENKALAEEKNRLAQTNERLAKSLAEKDRLIARLESEFKLEHDKVMTLTRQMTALKHEKELADAELAALRAENTTLRAEALARAQNEFSIRREITGLPDGPLRNVVILFDTSSSMTGSSAWEDARRLVRVWLTYLPIEECILVTFNNDIRTFPTKGFLRLRQTNGAAIMENQSKLLEEINNARLGTYTDTLKALQLAYSYKDINLILLFTDGKPKTQFVPFDRLAPQIYSLVEQHPSIPILAVALGDYEKLEGDDKRTETNLQIQFLKRLAQLSKGSFMAR